MADCGINGGMCKEPARPYDGKIPLEVLVEREKVRPQQGTGDLWQAAEAGLQFFRMLDTANLSRLRPAYLHQYALAPGADASSQPISAVVSGRVVDGIKLHADLARTGTALPAQPALCDADRTAVLSVAKAWRACYESLFSEPVGGDSWSPDRMEYGFALGSTSGSTQCVAYEYDGGHCGLVYVRSHCRGPCCGIDGAGRHDAPRAGGASDVSRHAGAALLGTGRCCSRYRRAERGG
jgi:hypothetical protein